MCSSAEWPSHGKRVYLEKPCSEKNGFKDSVSTLNVFNEKWPVIAICYYNILKTIIVIFFNLMCHFTC